MCPPVIVRAGSAWAKAAFCHGPFYYFSFLPRAVLLLPLSSSRFFLLARNTDERSESSRPLWERDDFVRARRRSRLPISSRFHWLAFGNRLVASVWDIGVCTFGVLDDFCGAGDCTRKVGGWILLDTVE